MIERRPCARVLVSVPRARLWARLSHASLGCVSREVNFAFAARPSQLSEKGWLAPPRRRPIQPTIATRPAGDLPCFSTTTAARGRQSISRTDKVLHKRAPPIGITNTLWGVQEAARIAPAAGWKDPPSQI